VESIADDSSARTELTIMFRIISCHSWDVLQGWHRSCPGSTVEHLAHGLYVLTVPAGGSFADEAAA
jgi:hypothetical protein